MFWLGLLCVGEVVLKRYRQGIVVTELELLYLEVGCEHSRVEGSSSGDALNCVQSALQFLLSEEHFDLVHDDWSSSAVANQLDGFNRVGIDLYKTRLSICD